LGTQSVTKQKQGKKGILAQKQRVPKQLQNPKYDCQVQILYLSLPKSRDLFVKQIDHHRRKLLPNKSSQRNRGLKQLALEFRCAVEQ